MALKSHYYNLVTTQIAAADDEEEEFIQGDAGMSPRYSKQFSKQVSVMSVKSETSITTDTFEPDKVIITTHGENMLSTARKMEQMSKWRENF